MRKKKNLKKLLNLGILDYTNLTYKIGNLDMPYVSCQNVPQIDFLALYSQPSTYWQTQNACICFFEYDVVFDGLYGLWNAIYYNVKELQEFYIERFQGVKYFIAPDYSQCGDVSDIENNYRQFKARIVSIWLTMKLNAVVIPLVSCANEKSMKTMLDGMDDCKVVAFNTKGCLNDSIQLKILQKALKYTVDRLQNLSSIIVYSSSPNTLKVRSLFQYALDKGIDVQIPDNTLQTRNRIAGDS